MCEDIGLGERINEMLTEWRKCLDRKNAQIKDCEVLISKLTEEKKILSAVTVDLEGILEEENGQVAG